MEKNLKIGEGNCALCNKELRWGGEYPYGDIVFDQTGVKEDRFLLCEKCFNQELARFLPTLKGRVSSEVS